MNIYNLIIGIVPRNYAELLTNAAQKAGAFGGTVLRGRGTAANSFLQIIGFGDSAKDLVYIVTPKEQTKKITDAMIEASAEKKQPFGIIFFVNVQDFIKSGRANYAQDNVNKTEENNMENSTHKLITIIVNRGFADDAMDAARKAGATGGTILNARGTAKPDDEKFFGMEIVPEKDMIYILAPNEKADGIIQAVQALPCFSKPGSGIAFSSPANGFTLLGKAK